MSTSIAWQYKHSVEVTPKGLIIKGNRFYLIIYIPVPHVNHNLIMQCLRGLKLMHKNWVWKGYDKSVNLPAMLMKMICTQKLLIVLLVTVPSIYRKQAIVTHISDHSKHQKERRRRFGKHQNQANNSCNIKQFLTVPKLCEFGLIRKFRSRASIYKKNQLNRSYETQVMFKRSLNMNLNKFRNLKISNSWCDRFTG